MELEGQWWFPGHPEKSFSGKLKYEGGSFPQLIVTDSININETIKLRQVAEKQENKFILGKTTDGEQVTLYNSEDFLNRDSIPSFSAELLLKGIHVESEEQLCFPRLELDMPYLSRWLNRNGFDVKSFTQGKEKYNVEVSYVEPEPVEAELSNFTISINFEQEENHSQPTFFGLEHNSVFHVESEDELNITQIKENTRNLRRFISFCLGIDVYPSTLTVYKSLGDPEADELDETLPEKAELYYPRKENDNDESSFTNFNTLFGYTTLDDFEKVLSSWYEICDELDDFMDLYFSTRESGEMLLSNNFLNLARAIESYHRKQYAGSYMDKEDYRDDIWPVFKEAIPDEKLRNKVEKGEIDESQLGDFKNSLRSETKWGYEYSLRTRLKEIFDDYEAHFDEIIGQDRDDFVHEMVSTRNFLTHFSEESEEDSLEIEELSRPVLQLRFIVETFLLDELDLLEEDKVREHDDLQIYRRLKGIPW